VRRSAGPRRRWQRRPAQAQDGRAAAITTVEERSLARYLAKTVFGVGQSHIGRGGGIKKCGTVRACADDLSKKPHDSRSGTERVERTVTVGRQRQSDGRFWNRISHASVNPESRTDGGAPDRERSGD
jgi:hypothetical protein